MADRRDIHPAIRKHLGFLGINSVEEAERFLFPSLQDLPSPFLLKSIDTAVELVIEAIVNEHDILIWGDYDVDGITAASLLVLFFRELGVKTTCHIPDRLTEGYGLNSAKLREFAESMTGGKLLITVDCGIGNGEELSLAKRYGFKTIVTDHHLVPDGVLYGDAVINPKQPDCQFPYKHLSGVGVAFYLAAAVRSTINKKNIITKNKNLNLKYFLGLVSIGTIADIMPLNGVNRLLAKGGFESLCGTTQNGIDALFAELEIGRKLISSESISFRVAPAINAAGRLGRPLVPFQLFTSTSAKKAEMLAAELVQLNNKRKSICLEEQEKTLKKLNKKSILHNNCIVMLDNFHEGVLGIIASRLVEEFSVPALVCCYQPEDKTRLKGSARAPAGFDLYRAISQVRRYLSNFGGHQAAAGFSLNTDNYLSFKNEFELLTSAKDINNYYDISNISEKILDLSVSEALNPVLLDNLLQLEPTGEGNPKPVFRDSSAQFVTFSCIGHDRSHLKGTIRGKYGNIKVVGFNLGSKAAQLERGRPCMIRYSHSLDYYNGKSQWKIRLDDIGPV